MVKSEPDYVFLAKKVDELGKVKAKIAELCEKESEIKLLLIDSGLSEIDGGKFRATVSKSIREILNADRVRAILTPVQLATVTDKRSVTTVRVCARTR